MIISMLQVLSSEDFFTYILKNILFEKPPMCKSYRWNDMSQKMFIVKIKPSIVFFGNHFMIVLINDFILGYFSV